MPGTFAKSFPSFGQGLAEMIKTSVSAASIFEIEIERDDALIGSGSATALECEVVGKLYGRLQMGDVQLTVDRWGVSYTSYNGTIIGWTHNRDRADAWWTFTITHRDKHNIPDDSTMRRAFVAAGWNEF